MLFNPVTTFLAASAITASLGAAEVKAYDKISFTNVGFDGTFFPVKKLSDVDDKSKCTCEVADKTWFSGTNAPLADYVSVHMRGPLSLSKFAFYDSPSFTVNNKRSSQDWTRQAYYDAASQAAENVTFLAKAGDASPCLGKALTYADVDGKSASSKSNILSSNNKLVSDEEYVIYSNVSCPKSGLGKGCGVYRKGIPAYYGYTGTTKMFLFEFTMPTESAKNGTSFEYYDLPAIWLLNDHIARTSQYPTNSNCSCWASGCGEYDIFEVMNGTERNHLYSTFHTFQGIEDLGTGIQSYGYIPRDTKGTMKGGVIFDSAGNTISFISDDIDFENTYAVDEINKVLASISNNETYSSQLMSISVTAPTTTSKSNAISVLKISNGIWYYLVTLITAMAQYMI
ncbi:hypothetical protein MOSE0_J04698 [Monosporozyma servazzii]